MKNDQSHSAHIGIGHTETQLIYIYPDGDWYTEEDGVPDWKSDDYETVAMPLELTFAQLDRRVRMHLKKGK